MLFFSREELDALRKNRDAATVNRRDTYLFGCGDIGQRVQGKFRRANLAVAGFVDNDTSKQGMEVNGVAVISPAELARVDKDAAVVLASHQAEEMGRQCAALGIRHVLTAGAAVRRYGLYEDMDALENATGAVAAMELWDDAGSRRLYRHMIRCRAFLDLDNGLVPDPDQYFNRSVARKEDLRAVADCGPFDGQVYRDLRKASDDAFEAYYAFEPDPSAFEALTSQVGDDPRARLFNSAVGARPGRARFDARGDWGSRLSDSGSVDVAVDSIDHALAGLPVTMIKMDVEGQELEALAGAEATIRERRPFLAICCYHRDDHMWAVPLWIARLGAGYRLRLLQHGGSLYETVCHGIADGQ